jgi:hypothetical protein
MKPVSDTFPSKNGLKQGDDLSSFLFNCNLEYVCRKVQGNHVRLEVTGTYQLLVYGNIDVRGEKNT